jgi:DNA-binding response OmpR family regulator
VTVARKALVVSLDGELVRVASQALERAGFVVTVLPGGDGILRRWRGADNPSLILLDWELPPPGGRELCRELRENATTSKIPIIAMTGKERVADKVEALEAGADDCITTPLQPDELAARARALCRRVASETPSARLRAGPIDMDLDRWTITVHGQGVELTKKEFRLLQVLLEAKGRVLSRDTLLEQAWSHHSLRGHDTRTVDVHISRLRRKLGEAGRYIITVRNVGFRCDLLPDWISRRSTTNPDEQPRHRG